MHKDEPWFNVQLKSYASETGVDTWTKGDEIIWNQNQRQGDKHNFYQHAFDFISSNQVSGDYFEFGCHRCRTFRMALLEAKRHFINDMNFFAFDSFEGLPSGFSDHGVHEWQGGALKTDVQKFKDLILESGFSMNNITLCEGYYESSLISKQAKQIFEKSTASFINIDCDYYESAVPIFKILDQILQEGTILYIDDYFSGYKGNPEKGVSKAMKDWENQSSWKLEDYHLVGWGGKSFIVYK